MPGPAIGEACQRLTQSSLPGPESWENGGRGETQATAGRPGDDYPALTHGSGQIRTVAGTTEPVLLICGPLREPGRGYGNGQPRRRSHGGGLAGQGHADRSNPLEQARKPHGHLRICEVAVSWAFGGRQ